MVALTDGNDTEERTLPPESNKSMLTPALVVAKNFPVLSKRKFPFVSSKKAAEFESDKATPPASSETDKATHLPRFESYLNASPLAACVPSGWRT